MVGNIGYAAILLPYGLELPARRESGVPYIVQYAVALSPAVEAPEGVGLCGRPSPSGPRWPCVGRQRPSPGGLRQPECTPVDEGGGTAVLPGIAAVVGLSHPDVLGNDAESGLRGLSASGKQGRGGQQRRAEQMDFSHISVNRVVQTMI